MKEHNKLSEDEIFKLKNTLLQLNGALLRLGVSTEEVWLIEDGKLTQGIQDKDMITSLEKLFGICFHKYQLQKTEVETFIDFGVDVQYFMCLKCMKTKVKRKHLWCR